MGVDIAVGLIDWCDEYSAQNGLNLQRVAQGCLQRNGLPHFEEPTGENCPDSGGNRVYAVEDLAEYCRQQQLPYNQLRHFTSSQYQLIVPVDFAEPLPMFADRSPESYGLEPYLTPEEYVRQNPIPGPRWNGFFFTPPNKVYLLSSQQVMREIADLSLQWGFSVEALLKEEYVGRLLIEVRENKEPPPFYGASLLFDCCFRSIQYQYAVCIA